MPTVETRQPVDTRDDRARDEYDSARHRHAPVRGSPWEMLVRFRLPPRDEAMECRESERHRDDAGEQERQEEVSREPEAQRRRPRPRARHVAERQPRGHDRELDEKAEVSRRCRRALPTPRRPDDEDGERDDAHGQQDERRQLYRERLPPRLTNARVLVERAQRVEARVEEDLRDLDRHESEVERGNLGDLLGQEIPVPLAAVRAVKEERVALAGDAVHGCEGRHERGTADGKSRRPPGATVPQAEDREQPGDERPAGENGHELEAPCQGEHRQNKTRQGRDDQRVAGRDGRRT